jgi:hypothetical protein
VLGMPKVNLVPSDVGRCGLRHPQVLEPHAPYEHCTGITALYLYQYRIRAVVLGAPPSSILLVENGPMPKVKAETLVDDIIWLFGTAMVPNAALSAAKANFWGAGSYNSASSLVYIRIPLITGTSPR